MTIVTFTKAVVAAIIILTALAFDPLQAQTNDTPLRLPDARVGEEYVLRLGTDGRVDTAIVWRVSSSTPLPPGVMLDTASGVLQVKPTTARNTPYLFTIEIATSANGPALFTQTYALWVRGPIRGITLSKTEPSLASVRSPSSVSDNDNRCRAEEPVDVESNSDSVSITVRNNYKYDDPDVPADERIINLEDRKNPIARPEVLIGRTIGNCYEWNHDDYVVVHLVKWPENDPAARAGNAAKYEVDKEKWFLYRNTAATGASAVWHLETVQEGARIYGKRRVAVLLVHLTARDSWDIKYTVDVRGKIPGPVQNAIDLAGVIIGGANLAMAEVVRPPSYWGGRLLLIKDIPNDMTVKSDIAFLPAAGVMASVLNEGGDPKPDTQTQQPKNYSKVFDNEGRYHWDISVGIPVKSFKEVQYDVESGQVTAKEINRQNAYGFLNLFLNPRGVDTKGAEFYKTPHLVIGVPISSKPLDRPMVGLGLGFYRSSLKFNFFAGAVFNRVREPVTLQTGDPATQAGLEADMRSRRITKFIFGFNIPVGQFVKALKPKS
jgi:hypothetical protein